MTRRAKNPPPVVREWAKYISMALKKVRGRAPDDEVVRLAGFFAFVGPIGDHVEEFHALAALFIHPERTHAWNAAMQGVPAEARSVARVAACVQAYNKHSTVPVARTRVRLENVVPVMVEVADPDLLVKDCVEGGLTHIGTIFHPNTLQNARRRYRGQLSQLADTTLQADILSKVTTFESE